MLLVFEPLISSALWLTLAVGVGALLAWYAWRRPWGVASGRWAAIIGLMAGSAALVLGILLNPTWQERIPPPAGKPRLTILIDDSASMAATDMPGGRTRFAAAAEIARETAARLADRFDVSAATFSNELRPVAITGLNELGGHAPAGMETDLAGALQSGVDAQRPAGQAVLLLSDGNHNAGGGAPRVLSALSVVRAADAPVFTKTFGTDAEIHDLSIRLYAPQQLSFIEQTVPVTALLRRRGRAPEAVSVSLLLDDKEIARQSAYIAGDAETEIRFDVTQQEKGLYRYEVRIDPFPGEATQVNNYGTFLLRVVDEPIRVLMVEGKPYWDSKFLARTLSSDPSVELVSVVRMSEGRYLERTLKRERPAKSGDPARAAAEPTADAATAAEATTPTAANPTAGPGPVTESWRVLTGTEDILLGALASGSYQVVVLGRESEPFLSEPAVESLREWVSTESGALVCFRGQPTAQVGERLERLMPVQWNAFGESRFRMTLTDRGRDMRWFGAIGGSGSTGGGDILPHLPTLATSTRSDGTKPLATVLASAVDAAGNEKPVVTFQPYGGGRVVVVEGAGMWRWAFLPPAYAEHDSTYGTLWQSLLRWLVSGAALLPNQEMALRTDQVTFGTSETASATLVMRKTASQSQVPGIELTGEAIEGARSLTPTPAGEGLGTFRVLFGELPEGRYRARIAGRKPGESGSETVFDVRSLMEEQLDLRARPDLMARIAASTGGIELTADSPAEISKTFTAHLDKGKVDRIRKTPAWDRWWVLVGAFGLWATTWGVRRNSGLV